jgi:hypothetical protein
LSCSSPTPIPAAARGGLSGVLRAAPSLGGPLLGRPSVHALRATLRELFQLELTDSREFGVVQLDSLAVNHSGLALPSDASGRREIGVPSGLELLTRQLSLVGRMCSTRVAVPQRERDLRFGGGTQVPAPTWHQ